MAESYKKEFGFTRHNVTKQLNDKYRSYRKDIENTMFWTMNRWFRTKNQLHEMVIYDFLSRYI